MAIHGSPSRGTPGAALCTRGWKRAGSPAGQERPASPLTAATTADRPRHTDGDRQAAGDQSQAAARAARPKMRRSVNPAAPDPSAIPAIELEPKGSCTGAARQHPGSSANAIAVSAPLPARRWIGPTVSGRQTSVRTTGWRGRRTRDCGPMCACSTAAAAPRAMTIARACETASSRTNSSRRAVVVASAARRRKAQRELSLARAPRMRARRNRMPRRTREAGPPAVYHGRRAGGRDPGDRQFA